MPGLQQASTATQNPAELLGRKQFNEFLASALNFKDNAEWKGDKRFFITFLPHVSSSFVSFGNITNRRQVVNYPIRTIVTGSFPDNATTKVPFRTLNLSELSTTEIISHEGDKDQLTLSRDTPLTQNYIAQQHTGAASSENDFHNHQTNPRKFSHGSYLISRMNDNNPSLLVEMNKDQALPNDTGNNVFVVIPDNLHPFIKDNLEYFLIRAGINVSGDASQYVKVDNQNRNLP